MIRIQNTCPQRADERFERRDPRPFVPFAYDDAESLPSLPEVVGWTVLCGCFITVCVLFLGVA